MVGKRTKRLSLAVMVLVLLLGATSLIQASPAQSGQTLPDYGAGAYPYTTSADPTTGKYGPIGGGTGYSHYYNVSPHSITTTVTTASELQSALASATSGDVIWIPSGTTVTITTDAEWALKAGVILASNRGQNGAAGGKILWTFKHGGWMHGIVTAHSNSVVSGLTLQGPGGICGTSGANQGNCCIRSAAGATNIEVENCDISETACAGISFHGTISGITGYADPRRHYVHHCNIHNIQRHGFGYGVAVTSNSVMLVEACKFRNTRHHIMSEAYAGDSYEVRYCEFEDSWYWSRGVVGGKDDQQHQVDQHGNSSGGAGYDDYVHHNTFSSNDQHSSSKPNIGVRGKPGKRYLATHNWTKKTRHSGLYTETMAPNAFATRMQEEGGSWSGSLAGQNIYVVDNWYGTTAPPREPGNYSPPNQPSGTSPSSGATEVSLTPTLESSAFTDPDSGDTHAASQWHITATAGNYSSPVFDNDTDSSNLTSIGVPSGVLDYSTTYYWQVRYQDNNRQWSDWSEETSLATLANQRPDTPSNVSPTDGATGIELMPKLRSSIFSDDVGDSHAASRWQVSTSSVDFATNLVYDSGRDVSNVTAKVLPSGELSCSTTYWWHVGYQDNNGAWSDFSAVTSFVTTDAPANQSPNQPSNVSPLNGAGEISMTPTLQSSAFSDPDPVDTHTASQWQMTAIAGDYSTPVFDIGTNAVHLTSIIVPSLNYSTTYYWRVRYQDSDGSWSDWSVDTSFVTMSAHPGWDLNQDGEVDDEDLAMVDAHIGCCMGDLCYFSPADLNEDGCIDYGDLAILEAHYGELTYADISGTWLLRMTPEGGAEGEPWSIYVNQEGLDFSYEDWQHDFFMSVNGAIGGESLELSGSGTNYGATVSFLASGTGNGVSVSGTYAYSGGYVENGTWTLERCACKQAKAWVRTATTYQSVDSDPVYELDFAVWDLIPENITITEVTVTGPGITLLDLSHSGPTESYPWESLGAYSTDTEPAAGDTYEFTITYNDGSSDIVTATVRDTFVGLPGSVWPADGDTIDTKTPTFTWDPPSCGCQGYYHIWVFDDQGNYMWSAYLPGGTTTVLYNSDGFGAPLSEGQTYEWRLIAFDGPTSRALDNSTCVTGTFIVAS